MKDYVLNLPGPPKHAFDAKTTSKQSQINKQINTQENEILRSYPAKPETLIYIHQIFKKMN